MRQEAEGVDERRGFDRWDGVLARDLIVAHFHADHRGTFAAARQRLGASVGDREVFEAVEGAVRLVFRSVGADFSSPSRGELLAVVEALTSKAVAWGTSPRVVERLSRRMRTVVDRVGRPSASPDLM